MEESAPEVPDSESKRPKRTAAESGQGWVSGGEESSNLDDDDDDGTSDDGSEEYDDDDLGDSD